MTAEPPKTNGTISCEALQNALLAAHRPADAASAPTYAEHLAGCIDCRQIAAQLVLLDEVVAAEAPELPPGFSLDIRHRLDARATDRSRAGSPTPHTPDSGSGTARTPSSRRRTRLTAVWLAVAAVVIAASGITWFFTQLRATQGVLTYHRVELRIQVNQDLERVRFKLTLPPGARALPATAARLGSGRVLRWQSSLRRGENSVSLPIALDGKGGNILLELDASGRTFQHSVMLAARASAGTPATPLAIGFRP